MDRPGRKNSVPRWPFLAERRAFSVLDLVALVCVEFFSLVIKHGAAGNVRMARMLAWWAALPHPQRFLPPTQHAWVCGKCVVSKRKRFGAVGHSVLACVFRMRARVQGRAELLILPVAGDCWRLVRVMS